MNMPLTRYIISLTKDNIYVNKFSHVSQDGIFRGDNVTLVIPDGNSIRREENLCANSMSTTTSNPNICQPKY